MSMLSPPCAVCVVISVHRDTTLDGRTGAMTDPGTHPVGDDRCRVVNDDLHRRPSRDDVLARPLTDGWWR